MASHHLLGRRFLILTILVLRTCWVAAKLILILNIHFGQKWANNSSSLNAGPFPGRLQMRAHR